MVNRQFWLKRIDLAWREKTVIWLSGVRRVGKTVLSSSLPNVEYFDCELPRVRRMMEDPEHFLEDLRGDRIVLDEIHRLQNPSQLLKIAADHFSNVKVLATGSSTLGASTKFKDTLSGRKRDIRLTPMMTRDLADFRNEDLVHRLQRGGLPPFFMAEKLPERDFQEWMDAYWAKDIQELFRLERRSSFQRFVELILAQSGGIFEATKFARPCEVSRTTISNYLTVLQSTHVAHVIRPFSRHRRTEIVAAPKVYAFDTGFVCYYKGWHELRPDDFGYLWEHFVLNEMHAVLQTSDINYWRDKRGHEVDFIYLRRGSKPIAIECKWSADNFDPRNLMAFRRHHPGGENYVVSADIERSFTRKQQDLTVRFVRLETMIKRLTG
ncbi:MAG: ATP-binding protein [Candidatus Krumholzibacteria bacterium]|nr:ATP-binding protein [Candidatus Krumholzibacteria bacterium]